MKAFEYAAPVREGDVLSLLSDRAGRTEVLAGGTELMGRLRKMLATPDRVVNIMEVESMRGISATSSGVTIGAVTTLDEILDSPEMESYPAVKQAIRGIASAQFQCQGTLGGELCQRARCWYFRNGYGFLAQQGQMVAQGENRFHAIFGNAGPAKYVHPSRLAPALIALGASVRVIGPDPQDEQIMPLAEFFQSPRHEQQRETVLAPNQVVSHVHLPPADGLANATYEVRHGAGPDYPLVSAAAAMRFRGNVVSEARVVLGHVAPTPWISAEAPQSLIGGRLTYQTAEDAGRAAVSVATPLSGNTYKVQLAAVSVKRALLLAAGIETGGF